MRAQGLPQETVVYGLVLDEEWEGTFEVDASSGEITVGLNGSDTLVIVSSDILYDHAELSYTCAHN